MIEHNVRFYMEMQKICGHTEYGNFNSICDVYIMNCGSVALNSEIKNYEL